MRVRARERNDEVRERESVVYWLFIGTLFSNLYTAVDTPARALCRHTKQ